MPDLASTEIPTELVEAFALVAHMYSDFCGCNEGPTVGALRELHAELGEYLATVPDD